jgi:hypothetical protein
MLLKAKITMWLSLENKQALLKLKNNNLRNNRLIFVVIFSGIIGACTFSLFAISHHLGADKDFDKQWQAWYLLRPIIGGVLTIGADLKNLNLIGVAAISGLVGMFSEHAMHKLQDLADTLFGAAPGDGKVQPQKPSSSDAKT